MSACSSKSWPVRPSDALSSPVPLRTQKKSPRAPPHRILESTALGIATPETHSLSTRHKTSRRPRFNLELFPRWPRPLLNLVFSSARDCHLLSKASLARKIKSAQCCANTSRTPHRRPITLVPSSKPAPSATSYAQKSSGRCKTSHLLSPVSSAPRSSMAGNTAGTGLAPCVTRMADPPVSRCLRPLVFQTEGLPYGMQINGRLMRTSNLWPSPSAPRARPWQRHPCIP